MCNLYWCPFSVRAIDCWGWCKGNSAETCESGPTGGRRGARVAPAVGSAGGKRKGRGRQCLEGASGGETEGSERAASEAEARGHWHGWRI